MTQEVICASPIGVSRSIESPVYDELMAEQISVAKRKNEGELGALLGSGDTWHIAHGRRRAIAAVRSISYQARRRLAA